MNKTQEWALVEEVIGAIKRLDDINNKRNEENNARFRDMAEVMTTTLHELMSIKREVMGAKDASTSGDRDSGDGTTVDGGAVPNPGLSNTSSQGNTG